MDPRLPQASEDDAHTHGVEAARLAHAVAAWHRTAIELDLFDVAPALGTVPLPPGLQPAGPHLDAVAHLAAGRPHEALACLRGTDVGSAADRELLTLACLASAGDTDAYRRLLAASSRARVERGADWALTYSLASAAEACRDHEVADQTWLEHARHAPLTRHTYPRVVTGVVSRRLRQSEREATVVLVEAVLAADEPPLDGRTDPEPLLAAARRLADRGDVAGARLVLHTAWHLGLRHPDVEALSAGLTPPTARRYRILRGVAAAVAVLVAVPLTLLGLLFVALGHHTWQRWVPLPGLSARDSRAWRAIGELRRDPRTGALKRDDGMRADIWVVLVALLSFVGGIALATWTVEPVVRALGLDPASGAGVWLATAEFIAFMFGGPAIAVLALRRVRRRWRRPLWSVRRRAPRRRGPAPIPTQCRCLVGDALVGRAAADYGRTHLHAADDVLPADLARLLPDGARVLRCPVTDVLWLNVGSQDSPLLLRGAAASPEPVPDDEPGTGMYL